MFQRWWKPAGTVVARILNLIHLIRPHRCGGGHFIRLPVRPAKLSAKARKTLPSRNVPRYLPTNRMGANQLSRLEPSKRCGVAWFDVRGRPGLSSTDTTRTTAKRSSTSSSIGEHNWMVRLNYAIKCWTMGSAWNVHLMYVNMHDTLWCVRNGWSLVDSQVFACSSIFTVVWDCTLHQKTGANKVELK